MKKYFDNLTEAFTVDLFKTKNSINMIKKVIIFFVLIQTLNINAQSIKQEFYDTNGKKISKEEFLKLENHNINLAIGLDYDSLQVFKLVNRINLDTLDTLALGNLKKHLELNYEQKIANDEYIVINYITANPLLKKENNLSLWTILQPNYIKKLHKKVKCKQFWIYDESQIHLDSYKYAHINWLKEKDSFIKNLFYPFQFSYGNCTVIAPNGNFYSYYGEYGPEKVFNGIEILKKL
ncbi:hypothetical protein B0I03_107146 [Flavobacterium aquaticum]|uniref:Uncharacterized protein n=2 Tax=Flavobacterium aquaticum TaxID=1236486 RepID=A0A327YLU4_9FLAO|nr:hypothetical protein B0I03_107146 [Flavobacterium aquaticum]